MGPGSMVVRGQRGWNSRGSGLARRAGLCVLVVLAVMAAGAPPSPGVSEVLRPAAATSGPTAFEARASPADLLVAGAHPAATRSYVVGSVPAGQGPTYVTTNSTDGAAFVANQLNISVINGLQDVGSIQILAGDRLQTPRQLAFDPENGYVYVASGSNYVSVLQGTSVLSLIPVGGLPCAVAVNPVNGLVYVTKWDQSSNVSVISGTSIVATIPLPATYGCGWAVVDPTNGYLYLSNSSVNGPVYVVNASGVIATISVGIVPTGMAYDPATRDVYVASGTRGPEWLSWNVSVIRGTSVTATIDLNDYAEFGPEGVTYDSSNGYVYVASGAYPGGGVWVINGTSVIASIPTSSEAGGIAYDSVNGFVYAVNSGTNNVTVINGSFYYPSISAFTVTPSTIEVRSLTNVTATFEISAQSGVGTLSYAYAGLPPGCASSNTTSLTCTPSEPGSYTVGVFANNSAGYGTSGFASLRVYGAVAAFPAASPNPGDAKVPMMFTASPSNGSGVYGYAWMFGDGGSSTAADPLHAYSTSGRYTVRLWVNDSLGGSASGSLIVTVDPQLIVSLGVSTSTLSLGNSVTISAESTGGATPYSYAYVGLPPGCVSVDRGSFGCIPSQTGSYLLTVNVTDGNGVVANSTVLLKVVVSSSPTLFSVLESPYVLDGVVAVAAAVVVAMVAYIRRKRKTRSGADPGADARTATLTPGDGSRSASSGGSRVTTEDQHPPGAV